MALRMADRAGQGSVPPQQALGCGQLKVHYPKPPVSPLPAPGKCGMKVRPCSMPLPRRGCARPVHARTCLQWGALLPTHHRNSAQYLSYPWLFWSCMAVRRARMIARGAVAAGSAVAVHQDGFPCLPHARRMQVIAPPRQASLHKSKGGVYGALKRANKVAPQGVVRRSVGIPWRQANAFFHIFPAKRARGRLQL